MDFPQPGVCLQKSTLPLFGYAASEVRPKSLSSKISLNNVHFRLKITILVLRFSKTHSRRNFDPRASQTHFGAILVLRSQQTTFKKKRFWGLGGGAGGIRRPPARHPPDANPPATHPNRAANSQPPDRLPASHPNRAAHSQPPARPPAI